MRQLWTRAALIALTAGTMAGCETASAPLYPAREGQAPGQPLRPSTPNFPIVQAQAQPVAPQDMPIDTARQPSETVRVEPIPEPARKAPEVQSQALPPLTQAEPPPPPPVSIRPAAPIIVTSVAGPVVDVPGKPQIRIVESGDALDAIARGFGTTRAELVKLNDLEKPYRLKLGQKIVGPAGPKSKAYVVQTGDTLTAISKRFNVTPAALAEANDMKTGSAIRKGQKLMLPEGFKDKGPIKTAMPGTAAPVQSSASAPAPRPVASTRTPEPARSAPVPAAEAGEAEREPAAITTTTTSLSVTGAVVTVTGPRQVYSVKSGDTLSSIARRFDMSVSDLAEDNKLDPDKTLRLGQKVKGPATSAKAYVAQAGDTLTAIAKRFNVTPKALAAENDLKIAATLKKGQKIRLPDGFRDKGPIKTTTTTSRPAPSSGSETLTPATPVPYTPAPRPVTPPATSYPRPTAPVAAQPVTPAAPVRPIIESSAAPTEAEIIASGRGKFAWPLQGEIISDFGIKGTGQRNDGLNIRAAAGTPVLSAADGEVAYAGNQVPSFGNLVLVKHADGWVTAYAHLGTSDVKMRQQVVKGQQLGTVGATGGVTEPQLHFEMRFAPTAKDKARPVDPNLVLPK